MNLFPGATDVFIYFEAGGACWDYESCTGGERGAAHPDGVPDDLMDIWQIVSPLLSRAPSANPLWNWNFVFVPYCTGDVHIGDRDITYSDPSGEQPDLEWHHHGARNTQAVIDWALEHLSQPDRMLASGCSAGGAGAINNYYRLRQQLDPARGYLLDDSGPIFPSESNSALVHAMIRSSWNTDAVIEAQLPDHSERIAADFGQLNAVLAEEFPDDRLATTYFRLDYDYALYSYERFYDFPERSEIYRRWWEDTQQLTALYDTYDNLAYYIPFYREVNNSHCLTILGYGGTEIEEDDIDLRGFIDHLLDDDAALTSHLETAREGEFESLAP